MKINVLPASSLVVVVYLVLAALRRILVRMLMLPGIGVLRQEKIYQHFYSIWQHLAAKCAFCALQRVAYGID